MSTPLFRCDITSKEHNCANPLMPIKPCTLCQKRTCGHTRCAIVLQPNETVISPWVLCLECSQRTITDPEFEKFCAEECKKCFKKN